jgi:hypothetical protein
MDQELLKLAAQMGAGGLMAFGMFLIYRKDTQGHAASQQQHIEWQKSQNAILIEVVRQNTEVNAKLCEKLDRVLEARRG